MGTESIKSTKMTTGTIRTTSATIRGKITETARTPNLLIKTSKSTVTSKVFTSSKFVSTHTNHSNVPNETTTLVPTPVVLNTLKPEKENVSYSNNEKKQTPNLNQ